MKYEDQSVTRRNESIINIQGRSCNIPYSEIQ